MCHVNEVTRKLAEENLFFYNILFKIQKVNYRDFNSTNLDYQMGKLVLIIFKDQSKYSNAHQINPANW